jgi:hypothetical protein
MTSVLDSPLNPTFVEIEIDRWFAAKFLPGMVPNYLFRGHADAAWKLESSVERAANRWEHPLGALRQTESMMIREFQRQAHHYMRDLPEADQYVDWLAIMQHYGAPTRLLDFTRSATAQCGP